MKYKPPYWFHDNIKFSEKQIQDLKDDMNNLVDEKQQNPKTNISTYFLKDENSGKYMSHKSMNLDKKFNDYIQNILIQSSINNQDPSLNLIIRKFNFLNPSDFVLQTHERLRKEIEKVVRAPEHDTSFPSLIRTAYQGNNGKGIYRSTRKGKGIDIYDALYLLNNLRNEIAHPRNNKRMIYGITYASMFVEILEKIRQDD